MEKIKVDTGQLRTTEETVRGKIKAINSALDEIRGQITALNQMWTGEANATFNSTFQQDITDLETLVNSMTDIADYENTARGAYENCEASVEEVIASIQIS